MYKGFNLKLSEEDFKKCYYDNFVKSGRLHYDSLKSAIKDHIDKFKLSEKEIDASKMQANWFPPVKTDIFLSHSHKDEDLAIALSELIREQFGLQVFIDSCLWGNSSALQRLLDNKFCKNDNDKFYDYGLRNLTTSHVHMMLQTALATMIDVTECVIFLNTPNSICPGDVVSKTLSPWIYSELTTTKYVRNKDRAEYRLSSLNEGKLFDSYCSVPNFKYEAPTEHLINITHESISSWIDTYSKAHIINKNYHGLDALYLATNCIKQIL